MQINRISNIKFESKKSFVSDSTQKNAHKLLDMMEKNAIRLKNKNGSIYTDALSSVSLNKNIRFSDNRLFRENRNNRTPDFADCSLYIDNQFIHFNSESGEVFGYKKALFTRMKTFLYNVEQYINTLLTHYNDPEVVTKNRLGIKLT